MLPDLSSVPSGVYYFEVIVKDEDLDITTNWYVDINVVVCSIDIDHTPFYPTPF